jgi:hypothetical protein
MSESAWAKKVAGEFRAARAAKAEDDAGKRDELKKREAAACRMWAELIEALKSNANAINRELEEGALECEAPNAHTFIMRRKDIVNCIKASFRQGDFKIEVNIAGRVVPLEVVWDFRNGRYQLEDAGGHACELEESARTFISEFLGKF